MADETAEKVAKPQPRPRPTPRQSFQRFIMIFLGILAIYVLVFPDVGEPGPILGWAPGSPGAPARGNANATT